MIFLKSLFVIIQSLLLTRLVIPHQPFLMFFADNLLYKDFVQQMSEEDAGNLIEFLAICSELLVAIFASIATLKISQKIIKILK